MHYKETIAMSNPGLSYVKSRRRIKTENLEISASAKERISQGDINNLAVCLVLHRPSPVLVKCTHSKKISVLINTS